MKNLLLSTFLFCASQMTAQSYMTTGGLRIGTDWGFTVNQRIAEHLTVEGIVQSSFQREEVILTGLVRQHYPLAFRGLNFYLGGGPHKGWYTADTTNDPTASKGKDPFGLTGMAGIELTLVKSLNLSYDFKPAVNLMGGERTIYTQTGLSIRYVFKDDKEYQKRLRQKRRDARKEKRQQFWKEGDWKFWEKGD